MVVSQEGRIGKILVAGIAYAIVSQAIHGLGAFLTMDYYANPNYLALWSKLMMPAQGPPGLEFYATSLFASFIAGLIFAYAYSSWVVCVAGANTLEKGLNYGFILFLVAGVTNYLALYVLLAIPTSLLIWWAAEGLVIFLSAGFITAKVFE